MELRIIDGQPFVITRAGKKETATPAAEVVATSRQRLKDAREMLVCLEQSTGDAQRGLESALLRGEPTATFRAELANIAELVSDQQLEITDANGDIAHIHQLRDQHAATQIRLADADAIAALIKPFTDFLENQQ